MNGDAGLTERGRLQAALLEERLRNQRLRADRLYASTLPRALETAEYVARALNLPIETDDDLQELRPGEADGLTIAEWQSRFPGLESGSVGQSLPSVRARRRELGAASWPAPGPRWPGSSTSIRTRPSRWCATAECWRRPSSWPSASDRPASTRAFAPLNTSITHWRHRPPAEGPPEWTLVTFNDAGHLAGEPAGEPGGQAVPTPAEEGAA